MRRWESAKRVTKSKQKASGPVRLNKMNPISGSLVSVFLLWLWFSPGALSNEIKGSEPVAAPHGQRVYLTNCAVCHGVYGDGKGTAAHMFETRPRDFTKGLFKFRSTPFGSLPTDTDLIQLIKEGVRSTGMIGRPELSEADRRALSVHQKFLPTVYQRGTAIARDGPADPGQTTESFIRRAASVSETPVRQVSRGKGERQRAIRNWTTGQLGLAD